MTLEQISVPMSKQDAFALADAVMEEFELALSASAFEDENGNWVFEATCAQKPDLYRFNALAKAILNGVVEFKVSAVPEKDWVAHSLEGLSAINTGEFFVHGSHDNTEVPAGKIEIEIDAGQAFGTGHHETTTGCLEAISVIASKGPQPKTILDLGTGTGILAIAAAKRFQLPVLATDIDAIATNITEQNAKINNVNTRIETVTATGFEHEIFEQRGPFDLILANILAGPLKELAPEIARHAAPGGKIVLAGLLERQAEEVMIAYATNNCSLVEKVDKGDWSILSLVHN